MARPTKLTPEMIEKAREYANTWADNRVLPTLESLALYLQVNRSSIYEWKEKDEEFSNIVDGILAEQSDTLIVKGLKGTFNPTITKLILSGKHGYVEKTEIDQNVSGNVQFINDVPRPDK